MLRRQVRNCSRAASVVAERLEDRRLMTASNVTPSILVMSSTIGSTGDSFTTVANGSTITWPAGVALNVSAVSTIDASASTSGTTAYQSAYPASGLGSTFTAGANPGNSRFTWDFGDTGAYSGDTDHLVGFNAAHVYDLASVSQDTPVTQNFVLTLNATDQYGVQATPVTVTVHVTTGAATANGKSITLGPSTPDVAGYTGTNILYVDSSATTEGTGTSESSPLQTFGQALQKYESSSGSITQIRLKRGNSTAYSITSADYHPYDGLYYTANLSNLLIGAYGPGTAKPVVDTTDSSLAAMIAPDRSTVNLTVQDLQFTASASTASSPMGVAIAPQGVDVTMRRCIFGSVGQRLSSIVRDGASTQANLTLDGFLFDANTDQGIVVDQYGLLLDGNDDDIVITGNMFTGGSIHQPFLRFFAGNQTYTGYGHRTLFEGNDAAPSTSTAYTTALTYRANGYYNYTYGNTFQGIVNYGNGSRTNGAFPGYEYEWGIFEDNRLSQGNFSYDNDDFHVIYRNNIIEQYTLTSLQSFVEFGADSVNSYVVLTDGSIGGIQDLEVVGNTIYIDPTVDAQGPDYARLSLLSETSNNTTPGTSTVVALAKGLAVVDNLLIDSGGAFSATIRALAVYSPTEMVADYDNVFPVANPHTNELIADAPAMLTGTNPTGLTIAQWNTAGNRYAANSNTTYNTTSYNDLSEAVAINNDGSAASVPATATYADYAVTSSYATVAAVGAAFAGDTLDFYGNPRQSSSWTVGAVQTLAAPAAPTSPAAAATSASAINVTWAASTNATSYVIQRSANGTSGWTQVGTTTTATTFTDTGLTASTTYYYRVEAVNAVGTSSPSSVVSATTSTSGAWNSVDIGSVGSVGSSSTDPNTGVITITAGGGDIVGTADAFHFDYQTMAGNGTVTAQVTGQSGTGISGYAKAGVMVRGSTSASAAMVAVSLTPTHGVQLAYRSTDGGSVTVVTYQTPATTGEWVRIQRTGATTFAGQYSTDGVTWNTEGTVTIAVNQDVLAGLAAATANTATTNTDTFASASVTEVELLTNGGFETGSISPWTNNTPGITPGPTITTANTHAGTYAVDLSAAGSGIYYYATGLTAGVTYTFQGYVDAASSTDALNVSVKDYGGGTLQTPVTSTTYSLGSVSFTEAAGNTTAVLFVIKPSGTGTSYLDDFSLFAN